MSPELEICRNLLGWGTIAAAFASFILGFMIGSFGTRGKNDYFNVRKASGRAANNKRS